MLVNLPESKFLIPDFDQVLYASTCSSLLPLAEMIDINISAFDARQNLICVINRVHRSLSRGKRRLISVFRTELLSLDWLLMTMIWERKTYSLTPLVNSWSILFRSTRSAILWIYDRRSLMFEIIRRRNVEQKWDLLSQRISDIFILDEYSLY